ncbi:hypothetical protein ACFX12_010487 [Malus domestica]
MAAVTLLALGNGAPDVFGSVAAVRTGQYRTGFVAILSAGTFVSAFVVGFVAIYAAPFSLNPAPFVRDVLFYLTAALFLFYVYLSAEIYLLQFDKVNSMEEEKMNSFRNETGREE